MKKAIAMVLLVTMLFSMNGVAMAAETAESDVETGQSEDSEDLVEISTQEDLEGISKDLSGSYILTDSITLEGDWEPIGGVQVNLLQAHWMGMAM